MQQYKDLVQKVYEYGEHVPDRTGTGTRRLFGDMMKFDCSESLPLVTVKYTHYPAVIHELLWFISGSTNIKYLKNNNVRIWDEWATDGGEIGPMYGFQWRNSGAHKNWLNGWEGGADQLQNAINDIKNNPTSRRIIVDCWDPIELPDLEYSPKENAEQGLMALAPCHMMFQFYVDTEDKLHMTMYQRSVDTFLGLPFNIASYAILLSMVAQVSGKTPGIFTWMGGDIHIYNNHVNQVEEMLEREPLEPPKLELNPNITSIDDFNYEDIKIVGYEHHPPIKGKISV